MSDDLVLVEREGRLTIITINRSEHYNALDPAAQLALQGAFDRFAEDDGQWVAILTGAGAKAFCGGIQRLPHELGLKRAMGLLLTGRRVKADEALTLGLVNEVASGDIVEAAKRWAHEILACSPMEVHATKETTLRGLESSLADGMAQEWHYPAMKAMKASQDAVESPQAFTAKRAPIWTWR